MKIFAKIKLKSIKPFNSYQIDRLSEIASNMGLVFIVSQVIPEFNHQITDMFNLISGIFVSTCFFMISLIILKLIKNDV